MIRLALALLVCACSKAPAPEAGAAPATCKLGAIDALYSAPGQPEPLASLEQQVGTIYEISPKLVEANRGSISIYDANSPPTRARFGVVPGATLLDHYKRYDAAVLPDDRGKPIVFYCANVRCTASDAAACKAIRSGYERVHVMRAGIQGWIKEGYTAESFPSQ